jgi:hypothetical protein
VKKIPKTKMSGIARISKTGKSLVIYIDNKLYFILLRDLNNLLESYVKQVKVLSWK